MHTEGNLSPEEACKLHIIYNFLIVCNKTALYRVLCFYVDELMKMQLLSVNILLCSSLLYQQSMVLIY